MKMHLLFPYIGWYEKRFDSNSECLFLKWAFNRSIATELPKYLPLKFLLKANEIKLLKSAFTISEKLEVALMATSCNQWY